MTNTPSDEKFDKDSVIDEIFNNSDSFDDAIPVKPVLKVDVGSFEEDEVVVEEINPMSEDESDEVVGPDSNVGVEDEADRNDSDVTNTSDSTNMSETSSKAFSSDEYFEDDEEFLAGDDEVVHDGDVLSMFQQEDDVVSVEVMNLYTESGNLRNKFQLRSDPPVLQIKSSDGQLAQFVLTKNFSQSLSAKLDDVSSAYYGLESKSSKLKKNEEKSENKASVGDFLQKIGDWAVDNKLKSGLLLIVVLLVIFGIVF